jgi:hypothetical protein
MGGNGAIPEEAEKPISRAAGKNTVKNFMKLDFQAVHAILSGAEPYNYYGCDGARWLALDGFSSCDIGALDHLVANVGPVEGVEFGLEYLDLTIALKLRRFDTQFLFLENLHSLDEDAARILGKWSFGDRPIRSMTLLKPISAIAARGLVGSAPAIDQCDRPLSLTLPSITVDVANALMSHTHELSLYVRDEMLSPEVAALLAWHSGYHLYLTLPCSISVEARVQLSSNPAKRISIQRGGTIIYVVDHDSWASGYEEQLPPLDAVSLGR